MSEQTEEWLIDGTRRVTWFMESAIKGEPPYTIIIDTYPDKRVTVNGEAVGEIEARIAAQEKVRP
jgi:hypothetical protein